jgi:hypothetical protein
MTVPQLLTLIEAAAPLESSIGAEDIYEFINSGAIAASTPSMAQSLCAKVCDLCHPRAWGDRNVDGFDLVAWNAYLRRLSCVAASCGQAIFDAGATSTP